MTLQYKSMALLPLILLILLLTACPDSQVQIIDSNATSSTTNASTLASGTLLFTDFDIHAVDHVTKIDFSTLSNETHLATFYDDYSSLCSENSSNDDESCNSIRWITGYADDHWMLVNGSGVFPTTDQNCKDPLGGTGAAVDNWLIHNQHSYLADYIVETTFTTFDNDGVGLVFHFQDPNNYFLAYTTWDQVVTTGDCNCDTNGPKAQLIQVINGENHVLASTTNQSLLYIEGSYSNLFQVYVMGETISVYLNDTEIFSVEDKDPTTFGNVGLWSYSSGKENGSLLFDTLNLYSLDYDGDGLSEFREFDIGTDPFVSDTDLDGYSDGEELLEDQTVDTDNDGIHDALDSDSHPAYLDDIPEDK